jgi:bacterial/archaeal transporter family protein
MPVWILYALIAMLFAGITAVIAKMGMKDIPSDLAVAIRTMVVFMIVSVNFLIWHSTTELKNLSKGAILFLSISGVTTAMSWIFYYKAIKIGNVATVATIDKASIVITILLSFFLLKEPVTWKVIIGAGLILTGLLVLVWK